jgi:drug/metabolite transporter (DMT)-like permease
VAAAGAKPPWRARPAGGSTLKHGQWMVHLGLAAVAGSWAVNQTLTKVLLRQLTPLAFLGSRYVGLVGLAILLLAGPARRTTAWTRRESALAAAAGVSGFLANQLAFAFGLAHTTVFSSALLIATSPLFALLALAAWRIERVVWRQGVGVVLGFAGIVLFLADGARLGVGGGDLLSLVAGLTFAAQSVCNKAVLARHGAGEVLAVNLLWGGIPLVALGAPSVLHADWAGLAWPAWAALAYTVVVPVFAAYQVWNWAIGRVGVGRTIAYANLTPVLAGVLSAAIFGEPFDGAKLLGAAACLAGLGLAASRDGAASRSS